MRLTLCTFLSAALLTSGAMAQPFDGKTAKGLLFSAKGAEVQIVTDALSERDAGLLAKVGQTQSYYGAIAISPDDGILSEATVATAKYHDVASAAKAALAGCNARRGKGKAACVVAAEIRPKGWEERPLQLNADATKAVQKDYRRGRDAKALATSVSTGQWGLAKGDDAASNALATCAGQTKAKDCRVVVTDSAK